MNQKRPHFLLWGEISGAPCLMPIDEIRKAQGFNNFEAMHNAVR